MNGQEQIFIDILVIIYSCSLENMVNVYSFEQMIEVFSIDKSLFQKSVNCVFNSVRWAAGAKFQI